MISEILAIPQDNAPTAFSGHRATNLADLPFWMALFAGIPIAICMAIMGLPDLSRGTSAAFRALYMSAYIAWIFPLAYLQRSLWRRRLPWWKATLVLLVATYAMSLFNCFLGLNLAVKLGGLKSFSWTKIFGGLDGCWLALIAFCAIHTVIAYYAALGREQLRVAHALGMVRDAQLRALRYQLHPHFLFNTLNAISSLVANERNREATRMIAQLGDFLRATLDSEDSHEHALADELALTEGYLDIEKARLGERLCVGIHVGPDVLRASVPYLMLQPLVENAIRHGIAQRSEAGCLDLHIARSGNRLLIRLENDGAASVATDEELARQSSGIGLRNVSERLKKLYPDDHDFSVKQGDDGKYQVTINLPFHAAAMMKPELAVAA